MTQLLQKFAPIGIAALGVIVTTTISTVPAQAASFSEGVHTLEWDNGIGNTLPDAADAFGPGTGPFDVIFSDPALGAGGIASVFIATGDFAPYFTPGGGYTVNGGSGETSSFSRIGAATPGPDGSTLALFEVNDPVSFVLSTDVPGATVSAVLPQGTDFEGILLADGSVNFTELDGEWQFTISDPTNFPMMDIIGEAASSTFEFSQDGLSTTGGGYNADGTVVVAVPEPASIFGLILVGGLGLSLKRKKQN